MVDFTANVLINFKDVNGGETFYGGTWCCPRALAVDKDSTILDLRAEVSEASGGAPLASFRLLYAGKVLKDEETLATHGLQNGDFVEVSVRRKLHECVGKLLLPPSSQGRLLSTV